MSIGIAFACSSAISARTTLGWSREKSAIPLETPLKTRAVRTRYDLARSCWQELVVLANTRS